MNPSVSLMQVKKRLNFSILIGSLKRSVLPMTTDVARMIFSADRQMRYLTSSMIVSLTKLGWNPILVPPTP